MTASSSKTIRVGARGSKLSIAQANSVLEILRSAAPEGSFTLEIIKTKGDIDQRSSLAAAGGTGIFVKELESALSRGDIDLAVHSAKDMPSKLPEGFVIAAVSERGPVEDAFISVNGLGLKDQLPGARIATGSPRRRALVRLFKSDVKLVDVRGNVDTRLRKLKQGQFDALILALAGLQRLGLQYHVTQIFPPEEFLPAPGQGALALEARADDKAIIEIAAKIDSKPDHAALTAERGFLAELRVGCSIPVGAWARWEKGKLRMDAAVIDDEGRKQLKAAATVATPDEAEDLGRILARDLLEQGAAELLKHDA